jgi:acyl transferase domain-containing protein/NADPH:quinone reductase-like Zn-dependent oxidoreductase/acyl carrier protein/short-subunit dehydrogenase
MKFRSDRARIAIIGAAFRMPGVGSEGFWEALLAGRNLVSSVESSRWAQEALLHSRKNEPGTTYTFAAGSIGDVSRFDATFFGISPREAEQMDPQQRLLLEMSWEAFESAAIPPSSMRSHRCGVYIGLSSVDYAYRRADDLGSIDATTMTGNTGSIAANRISYVFDLRGPSMTVDTACSSSLVALHQACQSMRHGESDTALVGGISLHLHPYAFVGFSKASMLSRHGRCAVFDEQGDGYVRSEGGAVVLLKPLAQAIADGNHILGVIAETGVNNDGRKTGLTVPSHLAQATLLREVYERAGIAPEQIDYFEAHGTGTAVGDPIEARAIGEAIGQRRPRGRPLPIGSVKSQVGHLEAASGMAGLIKALHVLRHRCVPPNIHLNKPNPHIDFADWNLAPVTEPLPLSTSGRVVVGVSAFGFGGTNAHAVLTSFEASVTRPRQTVATQPPLMLSARSPAALQEGARRMADLLRRCESLSDYDIAYSARFGREIHTHRLSAELEDRATLVQALDRFADSGAAPGIVTGKHRWDASAPAFVFSGNGSQWVGMGLRLLDEEPAFREALEELDVLFASHADRSIVADLRSAPTAGGLDRTEIAQPALFAIQIGVARLLESRGIHPVAVCGHSVGEVAAAWVSGALTLEAAVRVIYERSKHQAATRGNGCMAAVELGEAEITLLLATLGLKEHLVVAAINSNKSVTVAGDCNAMARLGAALARRRIVFRRLALDYAFHSAAMDPIREDLVCSLTNLTSESTRIPFYSTVSGSLVEGTGLHADYWWRNVREPVRFDAAIREMVKVGINTFVEVGPRPVLTSYLNDIGKAAGTPCFVLPTLTTNECGAQRIRAVSQQLELSGALHDPARLFPAAGQLVDLPYYAWQRERYWHPSTADSLGVLTRHTVHPLLGYALAGEKLHWENHLDISRLPAYADHAVAGSVVFPAAGFVEMALAAGALRRPATGLAIEDMEILAPLLLEAEHSKVVRLRIQPEDGSFTIVSRDHGCDDNWRTHAVGRFVDEFVPSLTASLPRPADTPDITADAHYTLARSHGLQYGPAFQSVVSACFYDEGVIGAIRLPDCVAEQSQTALLHPAYLDGAFQLLLDLAWHEHGSDLPEGLTFLPVRIDRLEIARPSARISAAKVVPGVSRHRSRRALHADFTLYDETGTAVTVARGVRFRATNLQRGSAEPPSWITTRAVAMPRRADNRASTTPSPAEAGRLCAQRLHTPTRTAARLRFAREFEPLLDVLCAAFAERALRKVADGAILEPAALVTAGHVCPDGAPLLRNLLEMLAEDGVLQRADGQWRWSNEPWEPHFPEPQAVWSSLIADYPEYSGVIARTGAAGLRLAERLRAGMSAEPRERHDAESTFSWIESCTREEAAAVFDAVHGVVRAAVASQPATARLRVLYILGTTSREEAEQATLPPELDRDHCDIVIAARTREALDGLRIRHAAALSRLAGHVLELDSEPFQGAEALGGRFDLVILSEGLADSPDPQRKLANIRQLLFGDGLFIMLEQHASRAEDLTYGLNASWWRLEGYDQSAPHSPRRTPHLWGPTLKHAGFEDTEQVCDTPETTSGPYLLIARAGTATESEAAPVESVARRTWLIVRDESGYSADLAGVLATRLSEQAQQVVTITAAAEYAAHGASQFSLDTASVDQWRKLLADLQHDGVKPDGWAHLAGLDLTTGTAPVAVRAAVQEFRASVLIAWLQACSAQSLRTDCWVVAAQAGSALLPAEKCNGEHPDRAMPVDTLRDSALWGLTRVAMQEFSGWRLRWIDLADPLPCHANGVRLVQEMLHPDAEDEIILTADGRFVPRMTAKRAFPRAVETKATTADTRHAPVQLDFATPGPFRNLMWRREASLEGGALQEDEVEIEVRAAGLNFRDVMYAMGLLPDEAIEDGFCGPTLGMELSGVVLRAGPGVEFAVGDEVIAIAPASFATRARTRAFAVTRKPPDWSFAAAATVPTAFFTAYYGLLELARLQPGERVLIHGAAGGVGIAAIQIAKHLGAEVLATAGTPEKRDFVSLLGADHVFDSRSLSFADECLHATAGAGVDVILNSLAGESMRRNLRLLRPFGRMIELGKRDFYENSRVGLRPFRNNIAYFGIDADQLIAHRPEVARRVFRELMSLFAEGVLHPLPHRSFSATDVEMAFRHMQASRHIGKIVVTFPTGLAPTESKPDHFAPVGLPPEATYLVTGGLGGFGLSTARWLVSRGARYLALMGRRGMETPEAQNALQEFARAGVTVTPIACDVSDSNALQASLSALDATMPPLRGVVHAAMVIEDSLIRDMSQGQLSRVLAPKVRGALNLHELTRERKLDFFLLYSSATTLFGNPGQAAYVAANMALEALAEERRLLGLPATCVGWGPIGDSGYLARNERVRDALVGRLGGHALSAAEALSSLDALLTNPSPRIGFLQLDWNVLRRSLPSSQAPKFSEFECRDINHTGSQETTQDLRRRLTELPEAELLSTITDIVRSEIAQILRIAPERIESTTSLFDMGMDSLMAVELATSIEGRLGIHLSALALTDAPTIERIAARIVQQLRPNDDEEQTTSKHHVTLASHARMMASQHASEITHEEASALSTELETSAPISLTAGQGS